MSTNSPFSKGKEGRRRRKGKERTAASALVTSGSLLALNRDPEELVRVDGEAGAANDSFINLKACESTAEEGEGVSISGFRGLVVRPREGLLVPPPSLLVALSRPDSPTIPRRTFSADVPQHCSASPGARRKKQARERKERGTHDRVDLDGVLKGAHSGDLDGSHVEDVDTGHVTEELVSLNTSRLLVVGRNLEGGCARSHWSAAGERRRRRRFGPADSETERLDQTGQRHIGGQCDAEADGEVARVGCEGG